MSWQKKVSKKGDNEQRGRLESADVMNAVDERIVYLKESGRDEEADCLIKIHYPLSKFIREQIEPDVSFNSPEIMRKTSRAWIEQFVVFAEESDDNLIQSIVDENGKLKPKVMESVVDIYFTLAHVVHMKKLAQKEEELNKIHAQEVEELKRIHAHEVEKLVLQLKQAKSVFTVRQALEEAAGAPSPKEGYIPDTKYYFWQKFGTDKRLQHIFEKHFNHRNWDGKKIGSRNDKLAIAAKLFNECWAKSSETVHFRPNSAPEIGGGIVAKKMHFRNHQQAFLQVIAEYLGRGKVVWLD